MQAIKNSNIRNLVLVGVIAILSVFAIPFLVSAKESRGDLVRYNPFAVGSSVEVHMAQNGNTTVRGAKVESKSGNDLVATMSIGPTVLSWTVETDSNTKFYGKGGGNSSLADISNGDYVSFQGKLVSTSTLKVKASAVKNWSIENNKEVKVLGKIQDINDSLKRFDLVLGNNSSTTVTVYATSSTIFDLNDDVTVFTTLNNGDSVKVVGNYDVNAKVITASKVSLVLPKGDDDRDDDRDDDHKNKKEFKGNSGWKNILDSWAKKFKFGRDD